MAITFGRHTLTRVVCTLAALSLVLSACGQKALPATDILTQKEPLPGRTPITVLVKYAFTINAFEEAVESKFPEIDIVQVGNYTGDLGITEYEARLKHGDIPDVVMTWPLDVGEEYWADNLLDLSGHNFTSRYSLSMLNGISREGKLYYLPGPSQIRGLVYNKTLFEENGWQVPEDYEGFLELCSQIEQAGIRPLQLGFANGEVLDTAFIGFNYASTFSTPEDIQWIADFNNGRGSFGEHFGPALDLFGELADAGIWNADDLFVDYSQRERMLFTRQCAMVEDSVLLARMGLGQTGTTDEFALMPFFNPGDSSDWARLYMVCYIGLNKQLAEPKNKKKYSLVLELMDYISTPEGQFTLAADTAGMYSSLISAPPPSAPEIEALLPALSHGRYAVFTPLQNAQGTLREGLAGMLSGAYTKEDVIRMVDEQNRNPATSAPPEVLGRASADFGLVETGGFVADAMRDWGKSDIALFLDNGKDGLYNGKGISASLYEGEITPVDVKRILPDMKYGETGFALKADILGKDLLETLEHAIPVNNNTTGWFYYFSGLRMVYNPTAPPGSRIGKITLENGDAIEPETLYSVVVMDQSVPEGFLQNTEKSGITISSIVQQYIREQQVISPNGDGRFQIPAR